MSDMKKIALIILYGFSLLGLGGCQHTAQVRTPRQAPRQFVVKTHWQRNQQQPARLVRFIKRGMLTKQGLYTNYQTEKAQTQVATGHELLLESSGLWLNYLAQTRQTTAFKVFYRTTKRTFYQKQQFGYRYQPRTHQLANVNATLDDLRVIRALLTMAQQTHSRQQRHEAAQLFAQLQQQKVITGGKVAAFRNRDNGAVSADAPLAYYDLLTLRYFETGRQRNAYQQQLKIVQQGYLGDAFPLYASSYNWHSKGYSNQDLNTSEALETLLHLAEVGHLKATSVTWLKTQVAQQQLANGYSVTGGVTDRDQSAGSYALAAMIFATVGEQKAYHQAMAQVWQAQNTQASSALYGALSVGKQSYSYNDLVGLSAALY
jgi:hypothetical protein